MLGNGNIRFATRQTEQRTHNNPLSNVSEVAKRRCNRQQHLNDCWNPDAVCDPLIYGCFHVQSRIDVSPVESPPEGQESSKGKPVSVVYCCCRATSVNVGETAFLPPLGLSQALISSPIQ